MASTIEHRLLVNYQADPERVAGLLPATLSPQLVSGRAVVGICLIRFSGLRPSMLSVGGLSCENAAHRIAVLWTDAQGAQRPGVFIPGRHTSSRLVALVGSRFYGEHRRARFAIRDDAGGLAITMRSDDGAADLAVCASPGRSTLPPSSVFASEQEVSGFFECASVGFSPQRNSLVGVSLGTQRWSMHPVALRELRSAFYDDPHRFPAGTIAFDSAMLMRRIPATWQAHGDLPAAA